MLMPKMKGNTADAAVPILKQKYWSKGISLDGYVTRIFQTTPEPGKTADCFELELAKELIIDGSLLSSSERLTGRQSLKKVGVGAMAGLMMAIHAAGTTTLQEKDIVKITCTGETDTGKGNPRTDFQIEIDRADPASRR
jgi:hypothetical protein